MNIAVLTTVLAALPGQGSGPANLDFHTGTLAGWRGQGFYVTTADPRGPAVNLGVCSSDRGTTGHKAVLRCTFVVPAGGGLLRFHAFAASPHGFPPDDRLDVRLVTDADEIIPKKVREKTGWAPVTGLLPRRDGRAREYSWDIAGLAGRRVQIILLDDDDRPGCYLCCSGFQITGTDDIPEQAFAAHMQRLVQEKGLPPLRRFESRHFVAWSNADAPFTKNQVRHAEVIYQFFLEHFRRRGFPIRPPAAKLLIAVFDSQAGFEAYLGQRMPVAVTGVYNRGANQLVVYDLSQNQGALAQRQNALQQSRTIARDLDRLRYLETIHRSISEWSKDGSLSTAMHETAHQLSFNCGLLNRHADVPLWLCEGLACYCEATEQGGWQGIGAPNPGRIALLASTLRRGGKLIPLRTLIDDDGWRDSSSEVLLGYSQSWALFRMLMQQRPAALRAYLGLIFPRRAAEHRLTDFCQAFGNDLNGLEQHYLAYVRQLTQSARQR
jgi:hypothetical protein